MNSKVFLIKDIGPITVKKEWNPKADESNCHFSVVFEFTYNKMPVSFYWPYQHEVQQNLAFNNLTQANVENIVNNFIVVQLGYN